jgi:hypothetical protein
LAAFFLRKLKLFLKESFLRKLVAFPSFFLSGVSPSVSFGEKEETFTAFVTLA